ncbi:MAG: bifunctional adenosylcobinamide kinase/adenosylcobinamide-phosphate guanylyltransferase [Bacillota bacterium]
MRGELILVTGGVRSGKSAFAENAARDLGGRVTYVATCTPLDNEMRERVEAHRLRRPPDWKTIEEPVRVTDVLEAEGTRTDVLILDCLGALVTNLLLQQDEGLRYDARCKEVLTRVRQLAMVARSVPAHVIIVSNEVGMGIVPVYPLGRLFCDVLGWSNQIVADLADDVYFMVAGIPIEIKPLHRAVSSGFHVSKKSDE